MSSSCAVLFRGLFLDFDQITFGSLSHHGEAAPEQIQAQVLQSQLSPHELAYQESLIQEREAEIREIETGIHELSEIFRDLGTLVHEQGGMIGLSYFSTAFPIFSRLTVLAMLRIDAMSDNIESNIYEVAVQTSGAAEELTTASEYQRKAGRRAACLGLVLIVVVAVVLLAVCSWCFSFSVKPTRTDPHVKDPLVKFSTKWRWLCSGPDYTFFIMVI